MASTSSSPYFSEVPDLSWSANIEGLRARKLHAQRDEFHRADEPPPPHFTALHRQRLRIQQFQKQWEHIKEDLPPQLSRRHIGMISMGGVIGTGLFVGSTDALYHGGPLGALLGYSVIGSAVYCLCVSIGEIIAFLPNVGGVVGLADLYVDRALGFSLGWAAWYNWCITLPAEITAAVNLLQGFQWVSRLRHVGPIGQSAFFLFVATFVNCFSSAFYGEFEYWLSAFKVLVIIATIGACLVINLGAGYTGYIGFRKWEETAPLAQYLDIQGPLGRFLGFWAVLMQASFSFFGSEVPGIAAGEVIDATRNVPRALRRVWIRITLFYVLGIFMVGLVVNATDLDKAGADTSGKMSPFWVAFRHACPPCTAADCADKDPVDPRINCGWSRLAEALNFAILISAWSAAASDIYIASRFLFFLSRRYHAPWIFATLLRYPSDPSRPIEPPPMEMEDVLDQDDDELQQTVHDTRTGTPARRPNTRPLREMPSVSSSRYGLLDSAASESGSGSNVSSPDPERSSLMPPQRRSWMVLPLYAVIASASVGLLSFLDYSSAINAFNWLVSVASIASLQSWAAMLFTYIRFYQGTVYAEKKARGTNDIESELILKNIEIIKQNRHRGQPWLAIYAFSICMLVLFTNGWAVFVANPWQIAEIPWQQIDVNLNANGRVTTPVLQFLASYIPIAIFVLLTFGYKLIHQTRMVSVEEMPFDRGNVPPQEEETEHEGWWNKIIGWALVR